MSEQIKIKVSDRRGEERWPDATQPGEPPPPAAGPQIAYAKRGAVQTTTFKWQCPGCQAPGQIAHIMQPKESEAIGGGGHAEYTCKCGAIVRVVEEKIAKGVLPGLPNNRHGRRASLAVMKR